MKRILTTAALFFLFFSFLFSYKVDVEELKESQKIKFINYEGPRNAPVSPLQRIGIGRSLAEMSVSYNQFYSYLLFSIIHAVNSKDTNGIDSDIFSILPGAKIDHIDSVRLIVSSYLSRRYGYSPADSMIIAIFVSYYNAVHRNDIAYFSARYKKIVMDNISGGNSGIDVLYSEWPGKTKMIIPLTDDLKKGEAGLLDTGEITGREVIDLLKNREDKGLKERKQINEIQKKEIEESKKTVEEKKKEIEKNTITVNEREKKTEEKKADLEKKKQELTNSENDLNKKKEELNNTKDKNEKALKEKQISNNEKVIEKQKKDIQNTEKQINKEENNTAAQKETLKKDIEKVTNQELKNTQNEENVKKASEEIKKDETGATNANTPVNASQEISNKTAELDQKALELSKREEELKKNTPDKSIFEGKFYYLKIKQYIPQGHYNNEMNIINPVTKKVEITSPFKDICGHKFDVFKDGVVVIGYSTDNHQSDHFLVLLDNKTLIPKYQGKDNIFWRSFVEVRQDFIYSIILSHFAYYVGKFDEKLEKVAQSETQVDPDTGITFFGDSIYVNDSDKKIIVLKNDDLTQIDVINP